MTNSLIAAVSLYRSVEAPASEAATIRSASSSALAFATMAAGGNVDPRIAAARGLTAPVSAPTRLKVDTEGSSAESETERTGLMIVPAGRGRRADQGRVRKDGNPRHPVTRSDQGNTHWLSLASSFQRGVRHIVLLISGSGCGVTSSPADAHWSIISSHEPSAIVSTGHSRQKPSAR
jgi:hypothetical protein